MSNDNKEGYELASEFSRYSHNLELSRIRQKNHQLSLENQRLRKKPNKRVSRINWFCSGALSSTGFWWIVIFLFIL